MKADIEAQERVGPLLSTRYRKDDGRALTLYVRADQDDPEPVRPTEADEQR